MSFNIKRHIYTSVIPWCQIIAYVDSSSLFAELFPSSCHTILVLAHLLFCWSSSNHFPHPAVPRCLSIFIAHLTTFLARLLQCENCSLCPVVPFRGNIFAWRSRHPSRQGDSFVCLDVCFFIRRFSSMRFHRDQKRRCSCCCSFSELFDCF